VLENYPESSLRELVDLLRIAGRGLAVSVVGPMNGATMCPGIDEPALAIPSPK